MCVVRFDRTLKRILPVAVDVYVQMPIHLLPDSEPEPDIAVVWHRDDDYPHGHPGPGDILLVVEVAETSLRRDRERKLPQFAAAGIRETWLADLTTERIWIYRSPEGGRYTDVTSVGRGGMLAPLAFPEIVLAVDDLLPPVTA
jgi:Uma2 family endonuclease